jgi:hypothetical protein
VLTDVRAGSAAGQSRVHARIAVGAHTGVELRAVERAGVVAVELRAPSGTSAAALRAELPALREALAARGLEGVTVNVRSDGDDARDGRRGRDDGAESGDLASTGPIRDAGAGTGRGEDPDGVVL